MNCFQGFPNPVIGGYQAMLRFAEDGQAEPVLAPGGKPVVFPTEAEAWKAVTENLLKYINGKMLSWGEKAGSPRVKAEACFQKIVRQKGATRRTIVERKGESRYKGTSRESVCTASPALTDPNR